MRQAKAKKKSAAQVQAGAAFAAAGRAKQAAARAAAIAKTGKPPPRTKKQRQASLKAAAAGQAAQARKRAHLQPLPKKAAALAMAGLEELPVCGAAAVAEHLLAATGITLSDQQVWHLHAMAGGERGAALPDLLDAAAAGAVPGARLARFWPCDADLALPGLVYGVQMNGGYHAVLAHPSGMISWGLLLPRLGIPAEAWYLEWEVRSLKTAWYAVLHDRYPCAATVPALRSARGQGCVRVLVRNPGRSHRHR